MWTNLLPRRTKVLHIIITTLFLFSTTPCIFTMVYFVTDMVDMDNIFNVYVLVYCTILTVAYPSLPLLLSPSPPPLYTPSSYYQTLYLRMLRPIYITTTIWYAVSAVQ